MVPVPSKQWLLHRLRLRDVHDRIRPPRRAAHVPPPLSLPEGLDAPADFMCA